MLYHLELQMAGVILLTTMLIAGIYVLVRRRREQNKLDSNGTFDATGGNSREHDSTSDT